MNKNPKTGKFMKKNSNPVVASEAIETAVATPEVETTEVAETTAETTVETPKAVKKEKVKAVQKTVKVTTNAHLQVFSKKTIN